MKCGTFFINSDPSLAPLDQTSVTFEKAGITLKQGNDIIALDEKQIKQLLSELNKEYK